MCPDLEAVFTDAFFRVEARDMAELSAKRPGIRCAMLGREISAETYSQMEQQLKEKHVLDLTGDGFELLSDSGIAELIRIPHLCDTLEAIFTDPANDKVTEAAMLQLKARCSQLKCVRLGREITLEAYELLLRQASKLHVDFTRRAFDAISDVGLRELCGLLQPADLRAVFFTSLLQERASSALDEMQSLSPLAHFVRIGDEITLRVRTAAVEARQDLDGLQEQLRTSQSAAVDDVLCESRDASRRRFIAAAEALSEAFRPG